MMFFFISVHYRSCNLKGAKAIPATHHRIGKYFKKAVQKRKQTEPNGEEQQHGSKKSKEPLTIDSDLDQSDKER